MQIRGHGNAVAIALAALAVVLAATGTAVAVTVTASTTKIVDAKKPKQVVRVNASGRLAVAGTGTIVDPKKPTQVARVDASGRLLTAGPVSTINARSAVFVDSTVPILSRTTASIAVTSIAYNNTYNILFPNTDYVISLVKITADSSGSCSGAGGAVAYRTDGLLRGASFSETFPTPLLFGPTGGKAYCIGVQITSADATHPTPYYAATISISGYAVSGAYKAPVAKAADARPRVKR